MNFAPQKKVQSTLNISYQLKNWNIAITLEHSIKEGCCYCPLTVCYSVVVLYKRSNRFVESGLKWKWWFVAGKIYEKSSSPYTSELIIVLGELKGLQLYSLSISPKELKSARVLWCCCCYCWWTLKSAKGDVKSHDNQIGSRGF